MPPLTAFVLEKFESDDRVFQEFCAGAHSLQSYVGDYAALREGEALEAELFLNHPLRRVREWAALEIDRAARDAEEWRKRREKEDLPT